MTTKRSSAGLSAAPTPTGVTQMRHGDGVSPGTHSQAVKASAVQSSDPLAQMRLLARQSRELTKIVFGVVSEHPVLARRETAPGDFICWEICAQLAAYLSEPDGERLVQPVLDVLEQLNMTAEDEMHDRLLLLAPELLAVLPGVAYNLPAALRLWRTWRYDKRTLFTLRACLAL